MPILSSAAAPRLGDRGRRAAPGFTLIELMIVVAVVAILVAIGLPAYSDSVRKARRAQAKADLMILVQRAERYYVANNTYADFWAKVDSTDKVSPRDGPVSYNFARTPDDSGANAFILVATPTGAQAADTGCGALRINQAGVRSISGSFGAAGVDKCW